MSEHKLDTISEHPPTKAPLPPTSSSWPFFLVLFCLGLIFVLQNLFLTCMCRNSGVKLGIAVGVDLLALVRTLIAALRHEDNHDYIYYLALAGSTIVWTPWVVGE